MKITIHKIILFFGISLVLSSCTPVLEQDTIFTEKELANKSNQNETVEKNVENVGEKTIYKISRQACMNWFGKSTEGVTEFINGGESLFGKDFKTAVNKNSYVEVELSEEDRNICENRIMNRLNEKIQMRAENSSYSFNDNYNELVLRIHKEDSVDILVEIGFIEWDLVSMQLLQGVSSDDWNVHTTIINLDKNTVILEKDSLTEFTLTHEDWE